MNHNIPSANTQQGLAARLDFSNPGEAEAFAHARIESYADGTNFMVWDKPGQVAEIAPVAREGTRWGWCTPEYIEGTVPDIFNVNGGDKASIVGIQTGSGAKVIIQDGRLYMPARQGFQPRSYDMNEYFTAEQPIIGQNWIIGRRDGDTSNMIGLGNIQRVVVEMTRQNEFGDGAYQLMSAWNNRRQSSGYSPFKFKSNQLRGWK